MASRNCTWTGAFGAVLGYRGRNVLYLFVAMKPIVTALHPQTQEDEKGGE